MWLMPKSSIMTEKLARRGMRVHAEYETDVLQQVSVGEMMDRDLPAISSDISVGELAERIARRDPAVSKHEGLLILDTNGNLEGIITRSDISRAFEKDSDGKMSVLDAGTRDVVVTHPEELLHDAAAKMPRRNIAPIVTSCTPDGCTICAVLDRQKGDSPFHATTSSRRLDPDLGMASALWFGERALLGAVERGQGARWLRA